MPTPVADPNFEDRWRMCFRKLAYVSEDEAKRAAKRQTKLWKRKYRSYACPVCHHWHTTKRPESR